MQSEDAIGWTGWTGRVCINSSKKARGCQRVPEGAGQGRSHLASVVKRPVLRPAQSSSADSVSHALGLENPSLIPFLAPSSQTVEIMQHSDRYRGSW